MKKIDILSRLKNAGVIAVVRGKSKEEALNACHAIIKGGLTGIELTFTVPQADQVIKELLSFYKDQPEIVIALPLIKKRQRCAICIKFLTYQDV